MDTDTLNNLFAQEINQYQEPIYEWIWRTNPYVSIFERKEFVPTEGLVPRVLTTTSELPTAYPTGLSNLSLSDGTADSCDVTPTTILDGYIERNYQLEITAFNTRVLCLTDLQFDWQVSQMIGNFQKNLGQYATVFWSDWYRIKNICMINAHVGTKASGAFVQDDNSDCDFSTLIAAGGTPTAELSWDHLNQFYDAMIRNGAGLSAVGMSEGQPLFALCVGPGYKRALYQDDTMVRDTVNWGDAFQNFTARGINTSINGFIPNVDDFPLRYKADKTTLIYPTINVAATKGRKFIPNPDYKTVANGGLAVYEVAWVLCRDIYEVRPRPVGPTTFEMAAFNPINYVMDLSGSTTRRSAETTIRATRATTEWISLSPRNLFVVN
jgi:hypothetical protein